MDPVLKDKRFAHVAKDPRFRKMPKGERKVKIDQRFKHMFKDKKFKMKYSVDKRGRPVNLTTNENLKKYYELSDRETSDDEETGKDKAQKIKKSTADKKHKGKIMTKGKNAAPSKARDVVNDSDESTSEESDADQALSVHDSGVDFARGESFVYSSSSSEDSSDAEEDENDKNDSEFDHRWGETDENVQEVQDATHRLAVCNMDWDRMKARDIYVLLNSLKPSSGLIKSVKIYPSEFGKERMAEEEKQGPRELTQVKLEEGEDNDDKDAEDNDGTQYHMEKLREYQLKRLRYFYAVVECDSVTTADEIYKECDGLEYESSCTKLDLRFIPEDMEFDESEVKSSCTEAPVGYKPQFFSNAALSQSKVDLTWDETDRDRVQLTIQQFSKKADEIEDNDLKAYLASSSDEEAPDYSALLGEDDDRESGEEDSDEEQQINKYKKLLQDIDKDNDKSERDIQMEITWGTGLKETTEDLVKKKKQSKSSTVWDQYLEKKKEKKKKKIEERKKKKQQQQMSDSEDSDENRQGEPSVGEDEQAFSDDELPGRVDMSDPFFSEELSVTQKTKKKKKGKKGKNQENTEAENTQEQAELSLLMMDGEKEDKKHFNYTDLIQQEGKKKKKKKNKEQKVQKEEDFKMDVSDPRFLAMYESHLFNIDPASAEFKNTKGTEAIIAEKLKRRNKKQKDKRTNKDKGVEQPAKKVKLDDSRPVEDSLASLVKSVKAKTKHFQSNKTKR